MKIGREIVLQIFIFGLMNTCYGDMCSGKPCLNGGYCKYFGESVYRCYCTHGWIGDHCEKNVNDCLSNTCKNGGQCIDQPNSRYICNCSEEYVGINCDFKNPCLGNPCKNGGICESLTNGKMFCNCTKYFYGDFCENRISNCPDKPEDSRKMCNKHGECQNNNEGKPYCNCDIGYSGDYCSIKLRHQIHIGCTDNKCSNRGRCFIEENGIPKCLCIHGYSGDYCENYEGFKKNLKHIKTLKLNPRKFKFIPKDFPVCNYECISLMGNGVCDHQCNTDGCLFDGGDCDPWKNCNHQGVENCRNVFQNEICNPECNSVDCLFDGQDCERSTCTNLEKCSSFYQNGVCDQDCNNPQCGFDGGDCQDKYAHSFFSDTNTNQKSSINHKEFQLDLILLTTLDDFQRSRSKFLQSLGSALKMVLRILSITEITFNSSAASSIKLGVNPTDCIIYGGQCFSSSEQIYNFIKAGMSASGAFSLPFRVADVETKTIHSLISKKSQINIHIIVLIVIGSTLVITLIVIAVLLRERWTRLKTKVKSAGVFTPSDGYSTSISSINSNHKSEWPMILQPKNFKFDNLLQTQSNQKRIMFQCGHSNPSTLGEGNCSIFNINKRKRRYDISEKSEKALTFQSLSENLLKTDGLNSMDSNEARLISLVNENIQMKNVRDCEDVQESSPNIGDYVNDFGESLMHIASRMNCGSNLIKKLYNVNPEMLYSTDEWGRTPLVTAVASDAFESVEPLLSLEKQSRKELKQKILRLKPNPYSSGRNSDRPDRRTTALIESVKLNSKEIINLLLDEGSAVNSLDSYGRSVVHWAAIFNNTALLDRLSQMKIFHKLVDLKDFEDKSPLYHAAAEGSFESVRFIVEYISKSGIKIDQVFPCPKAIALENGFFEIASVISSLMLRSDHCDKYYNRLKQKYKRMPTKQSNLNITEKELGVINEFQKSSKHSQKLMEEYTNEIDYIESCFFDVCSSEDSSNHNILDCCSNKIIHNSTPQTCNTNPHGYQSNASSSDLSPALLNFNHPSIITGHSYYSDHLDSTQQNTLYISTSHELINDNGQILSGNNDVFEMFSEPNQFNSSKSANQNVSRVINFNRLSSSNG